MLDHACGAEAAAAARAAVVRAGSRSVPDGLVNVVLFGGVVARRPTANGPSVHRRGPVDDA